MEKDTDSYVELVGEILDYFMTHPDAADTPEGIALWCLQRRRYEIVIEHTSQALEDLVRRGILDKTLLPDGSFLYSIAISHPPPEFPQ